MDKESKEICKVCGYPVGSGHASNCEFYEEKNNQEYSVENILREQGIEEGKEISLEQVQKLIENNPSLIDGIKRNFYWQLKNATLTDYEENTPYTMKSFSRHIYRDGSYGVYPFVEKVREPYYKRKQGEEKQKSDRETVLGDVKNKLSAEMIFNLSPGENDFPLRASEGGEYFAVSFVFSTNREKARKYYDKDQSYFSSVDDFNFEGVYVYDTDELKERKKITMDEEMEKINSSGENKKIFFEKVKEMVEILEPIPDADCSKAFVALDKLAEQEGVDKEVVEKLKTAITEYATFVKPEPTTGDMCFAEIGRCLTTPHIFNKFIKERLDIKLDTDHYGSSLGSYHEVNTFGDIFIDWTARQFGDLRDTPYPYIYHKNDKKHGGGRLWSSLTEEEKVEVIKYERMAASGVEW